MPRQSYTSTAILLHWSIALLIIGLFILGLYMSDLPRSPERIALFGWHKSLGVTVYLLACYRLYWRRNNPPPPLSQQMTEQMQRLAHLGHKLLYALMLIVPLSGWLMSSARGYQTVLFGVVPIPDLIAKNEDPGQLLKDTHEWLNYCLAATVLGHIGFALKHPMQDRNNVLRSMAPWIKD
jgi:cytochrome b561